MGETLNTKAKIYSKIDNIIHPTLIFSASTSSSGNPKKIKYQIPTYEMVK